ncbi:NAD(P)H:quinone oxidoreductase [Pseudomarimonas arenosa]|uniref:NAD(P)H:quinone oxidoreductase n=1 Tax=Pseudomarimonas arenosa TaxID=2774145 RepID=A0AAW3ZJ38_9GAMM|nr:NAD(P)H:quinone oxidoreductase [Pseudomarimonas arenosa]
MNEVLILYYSRGGSVEALARQIARGVESVEGVCARLRTVPAIGPVNAERQAAVPEDGAPYVDRRDLAECSGLVLGSPTRFGNMAAALKQFLDSTGAEWASGTLIGKPASVFCSTASLHGGQESTLLSMMLPLLHHGMLIVGLPYSEPGLNATRSGGGPYGVSHFAGQADDPTLSADEIALARAQGRRMAELVRRLEDRP